MNNDITLKSKAYKLLYSDKTGSRRRSTTDGATLPHELSIAHTDSVDQKTKSPVKRSVCRVEMTHLDTGGISPAATPVIAYMVVQHGTGVNQPSQTAIILAIETVIQALGSTTADASALGLADEIFVNKEQ